MNKKGIIVIIIVLLVAALGSYVYISSKRFDEAYRANVEEFNRGADSLRRGLGEGK